MATLPLTIDVEAETARAYLEASPEDRKKMQLLLNWRLRELVSSERVPLRVAMEDLGREAEARGLTPEILESLLAEGGDD